MSASIESMFSVKEVPWHGLGTILDNPPLTEDAINEAGLDWLVKKVPILGLYTDDEGIDHECITDKHFMTVRTNDLQVLGVVKGRYQIIQNHEAFAFMDGLAGVENLVQYHTAGSLRGGQQIWLLAKLVGLTVAPIPGDETEAYLLLTVGHDGRHPLRALFTSVRVVCMNTLNLALKSARGGVSIRHTGDVKTKVKAARKVLRLATKEVEAYKETAEQLAKYKMNDEQWADFLDKLLPLPTNTSPTRKQNQRDTITELWQGGPGTDLPGVRGTAWNALQAVTAYNTHVRSVRNAGSDVDSVRGRRLEATWFGEGDKLNQKAMKILISV